MKNKRTVLRTAAVLGMLAVGFGAFGAHALEAMLLETGRTDTYELAVQYHFYHTLSLLALGVLMKEGHSKFLNYAAWGFLLGCILFSGSLYALCLTGIKTIALITPVGGVAFIMGWLFLFLGTSKK